jgi:hypothetical protein
MHVLALDQMFSLEGAVRIFSLVLSPPFMQGLMPTTCYAPAQHGMHNLTLKASFVTSSPR